MTSYRSRKNDKFITMAKKSKIQIHECTYVSASSFCTQVYKPRGKQTINILWYPLKYPFVDYKTSSFSEVKYARLNFQSGYVI